MNPMGIYQYTRDKKLRETKNKRSRWIAVDDGTVAYLRTWRAVQARRMQVQGLTQAPFLIGNGIDPKSMQGCFGHEVSSMTMDVYTHASGGNEREAADLMGRLLMTGAELLELQRGLGVPVLLEGGRLTVMAKSA